MYARLSNKAASVVSMGGCERVNPEGEPCVSPMREEKTHEGGAEEQVIDLVTAHENKRWGRGASPLESMVQGAGILVSVAISHEEEIRLGSGSKMLREMMLKAHASLGIGY